MENSEKMSFYVTKNLSFHNIPKTSSKERLKANLDIENIEISREDAFILKTLPQLGWSGEHPDFVEV